jgi:ribonucleoside-diphosphate reductase alpha chain
MTINKEIPIAKSLMDYIGRWLAIKFLPKEEAKKYHNGDLVDRAYSEGTMTNRSTITLSEIKPKEEALHENKLIEVLEKTKIKPAKKAVAVGSEATFTTPTAFQSEDAPMCHNCGSVMIRNGSCYKCLDCGETSGCS